MKIFRSSLKRAAKFKPVEDSIWRRLVGAVRKFCCGGVSAPSGNFAAEACRRCPEILLRRLVGAVRKFCCGGLSALSGNFAAEACRRRPEILTAQGKGQLEGRGFGRGAAKALLVCISAR